MQFRTAHLSLALIAADCTDDGAEPEEPKVRRATGTIRNLDYARSASRRRGHVAHFARVSDVATLAEGQKNFDGLYSAAVVLTADACPSRWVYPFVWLRRGAERSGEERSGEKRRVARFGEKEPKRPKRIRRDVWQTVVTDVGATCPHLRVKENDTRIRTSRRCPTMLDDVDDPGTTTTLAVELIDSAITGSFQDARE
ncbi:hypothetical protein G5I_09777 [Acromyrmex echinatior]|uniref:Uncharacterized protein n=1 Tax=Acromyrmex echinatior TaxID=103372 RepID=F4WVB0_ACREC|nr:hypothetical protein G5I_09777 [Acromyrmex echinatior]